MKYNLTDDEYILLAYLLLKNMQSFESFWGVPTIRSLVAKGLLIESAGIVMSIPFTVEDSVWQYLKSNRKRFLPASVRDNPQAIAELQKCIETMVNDASKNTEILEIAYKALGREGRESAKFRREDSDKIISLLRTSAAKKFKQKFYK